MGQSGVGTFLLLAGLAWTAAFMFTHLRWAAKARAARNWPVTNGRILACKVETLNAKGVLKYAPQVSYSYSAGGAEHSGARVRFGDVWSLSRGKAEQTAARYPVGGNAVVRYDPAEPDESVLETTAPKRTFLYLSFLGLFFMAGGIVSLTSRSAPPGDYNLTFPTKP